MGKRTNSYVGRTFFVCTSVPRKFSIFGRLQFLAAFNTTLSKSIDFFPFPKKTGRSPTRGERSLPCFFVYLIYVESRREAYGCILPLTIIIIIPTPSRCRRRQQPLLPPHRQPSRTSLLAAGPQRAAPLTFSSSARQGPSEVK